MGMSLDPLSVLAHDIRGTLAGMLGMGLTLQRRMPQMEETDVRDSIDIMVDRMNWLNSQLDFLVELARAEFGQRLRTQSTDAVALVRMAIATVPEESVDRFAVRIVGEPFTITVDIRRMIDVLASLLSTAVEGASVGTPIDVVVRFEVGGVSIAMNVNESDGDGRRRFDALAPDSSQLVVRAHEGRLAKVDGPKGAGFLVWLPALPHSIVEERREA